MLEETAVFVNLLLNAGLIFGIINVSIDTVISGSRNRNCKDSIVWIIKVDFHCERDRLLVFERNLNFDFLFGNSQIGSLQEIDLQINIRKLLQDHVLDIDVFISAIDNLKSGLGLFIQANNRKNHVWLIKVKSWVWSWSLHSDF